MRTLGRWLAWALPLPCSLAVGASLSALGFWWIFARDWRIEWDEHDVPYLAGSWRAWCDDEDGDGPDRGWRYSTTFCAHIVVFQRRHRYAASPRIRRHEGRHRLQAQTAALLALWLAAIAAFHGAWWFAGLLVASSYGLMLPGFVTAWLRGENPYRDSDHEVCAYSEHDVIETQHVGRSWGEVRAEERGEQLAANSPSSASGSPSPRSPGRHGRTP